MLLTTTEKVGRIGDMKYICKRCKTKFSEGTLMPIHLGPGGQTVYDNQMTGDIICDPCLAIEDQEMDEALNVALEAGQSW